MISTIVEADGRLALIIPDQIVKRLGLYIGQLVDVEEDLENGILRITPIRTGKKRNHSNQGEIIEVNLKKGR